MRSVALTLALAALVGARASAQEEEPPPPEHAPVVTKAPRLARFVEAEYPQDKKAAGITAQVLLTMEIAADGHIHVYGRLGGHAHAGAKGMADARIFCDSLEAEVVAINDRYLLSDQIPVEHKGQRVQIFFQDGFHIERH